jgi:hypothetical protein
MFKKQAKLKNQRQKRMATKDSKTNPPISQTDEVLSPGKQNPPDEAFPPGKQNPPDEAFPPGK